MDYSQLKSFFTEESGTVTLSYADFSGSGVEDLFTLFFDQHEGRDELKISDATLVFDESDDEENNTITLSGVLVNTFLGVDILSSKTIFFTGVFSIASELPYTEISLSFDPDTPWLLREVLELELLESVSTNLTNQSSLGNPLSAIELESASKSMIFKVNTDDAVTLEGLSDYLQGVSVVSFFPTSGFPAFDNIELSSFEVTSHLGFDPAFFSAVSAEVKLKDTQEGWKPFGDLITFRQLRASALVYDPVEDPGAIVQILAVVDLGDNQIEGRITLPSLAFSCRLLPEESGDGSTPAGIDIKSTIEEIFSIPVPIETLVCTELGIEGDPEQGIFKLFGTITGNWAIDLGFTTLEINSLSAELTYDAAGKSNIVGGISGEITLGSVAFILGARKDPASTGWVFTGSNAEDSEIVFGDTIRGIGESLSLNLDPPDLLNSLALTRISTSFNTLTKDFEFYATLALELDASKTARLDIATLFTKQATSFSRTFSGLLTIGSMQFGALVTGDSTASLMRASFIDRDGFKIDLFRELLQAFTDIEPQEGVDFAAITIYRMIFQVEKSGTTKTFSFDGKFDWDTNVTLFDVNTALNVECELFLQKVAGKSGFEAGSFVEGLVSLTIADFEFLPLGIRYDFEPAKLSLFVPIGDGKLLAEYETDPSKPKQKTFTFTFQNVTIGDLLNFFIGLADPSVEEFEFESPWSAITDFEINASITLDLENKKFTLAYRGGGSGFSIPGLDAFVSFDEIRITYEAKSAKTGSKRTTFGVSGTLLGTSLNTDWDPVNEAPPEVPGKGRSMFELRYFGLGQRVTFDQETLNTFTNITAVMTALRGTLDKQQTKYLADPAAKNQTPIPPADSPEASDFLIYSKDSDWLIGASFVLLKTLDLRVIFNDPVIYGIRIELSGDLAKKMAGLQFEILYRRISDTVGVYHIELVVPDIFRQMQFGTVSITLPIIVLDIYTNGDFKVDFGFPWKGDFSRSFAVEVFPFTGAAGFYFNKLSAATATSTPQISNGIFDPVFEFGLGLKIGLGKTFNKGPLKAELSVTVQAIIEGVISWFNPDSPALDKEMYYKISGSAALVGRIYGAVDFAVIKVDVEVIAKATIIFVIEVYQPIEISLIAEVSVKASVKIAFIKVSFSFGLKVQLDFTIGSASPTPWVLGPRPESTSGSRSLSAASGRGFSAAPGGRNPMFSSRSIRNDFSGVRSGPASRGFNSVASSRSISDALKASITFDREVTPTKLSWDPNLSIFESGPQNLDMYFQPSLAKDSSNVQCVGLLYLENSIPLNAEGTEGHANEDTMDFDVLMHSLLLWALYAYYKVPSDQTSSGNTMDLRASMDTHVLKADLEQLYTFFLNDTEDPAFRFEYNNLLGFLKTNFVISLKVLTSDKSATLFPMLPSLNMKAGSQAEVDFDNANVLTQDEIDMYQDFFRLMRVQHASTVEEDSSADTLLKDYNTSSGLTAAKFVFMDYFALLIRLGVQHAIDYIVDLGTPDEGGPATITITEVLDALSSKGQYNHIAGMGSRFMLHGLRLPENLQNNSTRPVYAVTGQQFALEEIPATDAETAEKKSFRDKYFPIVLREDDDSGVSTPSGDAFITFPSATSLSYAMTDADLEADDSLYADIKTMQAESLNEKPAALGASTILFPYYEEVADQYGISRKMEWEARDPSNTAQPVSNFVLYSLPDALMDHLAPKTTAVPLNIKELTKSRGSGELNPASYVNDESLEFACGALIEVRVRKIPVVTSESDAAGTLKTTYMLEGTTEQGKEQLEKMWSHLSEATPPDLHVLYEEDSKWKSDASTACEIYKVNLSRDARTDTSGGTEEIHVRGNIASREIEFLKLLYEAGTVETGGFYFHYETSSGSGIPDDLFGADGSARLHLLVQLKNTSGIIESTGYAFSNVAVLLNRPAIDGDDAEKSLEEKAQVVLEDPAGLPRHVLKVPAGNIGIKFSLPIPSNAGNSFDLDTLYQMLAIRVLPLGDYRESVDGLPLGPTEDETDSTNWLYEKVIPVYACADDEVAALEDTHAGDASGGSDTSTLGMILPDPRLNPYRGFESDKSGAPLSLHLAMSWQDIYGNRLVGSGAENYSPTIDVHYTDPLLGINQWPSVIESYTFRPDDDASNSRVDLVISLAFDQTDFIAGPSDVFDEIKKKIRTARDTFRKVYYQIHQSDIKLTVKNTVIKGSDTIISESDRSTDLETIRTFIDETYQYLNTLAYIQPATHTVAANESLESLAALYYTTAEALATQNASLVDIYDDANTTPFAIPIDFKVELDDPDSTTEQTDSLDAIVLAIYGAASSDRVQEIIELNKDNPNILKTGTSFTFNTSDSYEITDSDTFESIAAATGIALDALGGTLHGVADLFFHDSTIRANLDYDIEPGDSFQSISDLVVGLHESKDANNLIAVEELAKENAGRSLKTGAILNIPGRVTPVATIPDTDPAVSLTNIVTSRAGDTFESLATAASVSAQSIIVANQSVEGLLTANVTIPAMLGVNNLGEVTDEQLAALSQQSTLSEAAWKALIDPNELFKNADPPVATQPAVEVRSDRETIATFAAHCSSVLQQGDEFANVVVRPADLTPLIKGLDNVLTDGQLLLVPTAKKSITVEMDGSTANYPDKLVELLRVQVDMERTKWLNDTLNTQVPEVAKVTAFLSADTTPAVGNNDEARKSSLRTFAENFQAAFDGLQVAIGENAEADTETDSGTGEVDDSTKSLWMVHFDLFPKSGDAIIKDPTSAQVQGIYYNIQQDTSNYFSLAPLANTLLAGDVDLYQYTASGDFAKDTSNVNTTTQERVENVDLNVLARDFLVAVEDFLDPALFVPAYQNGEATDANNDAQKVVLNKKKLTDAITGQLMPVLQGSPTTGLTEAQQKLSSVLLADLVKGYDVETLIQFDVNVQIPDSRPLDVVSPQLNGMPVVNDITSTSSEEKESIDITLSPGSVNLSETTPRLTFIFDTKTPEKFEDVDLDMSFKVTDLEYNVGNTNMLGIDSLNAKTALSFIIPLTETIASTSPDEGDDPNFIGPKEIPVPLRSYPTPPSLILHRAEADPDSLENLDQVREWEYLFTYEHLDIAQDTIEARVLYNELPPPPLSSDDDGADDDENTGEETENLLFKKLVLFSKLYPKIQADLKLLETEGLEGGDLDKAKNAVGSFAELVAEVADAWDAWNTSISTASAVGLDAQYQVDQDVTVHGKAVTVAVAPQDTANPFQQAFPLAHIPGFEDVTVPMPVSFASAGRLWMDSWDGVTYRWDTAAPATDPLGVNLPDAIHAVSAFNDNATKVARGYEDGSILIFALPDASNSATDPSTAPFGSDIREPEISIESNTVISAVAFGPSSTNVFVAGCRDGSIMYWEDVTPPVADPPTTSPTAPVRPVLGDDDSFAPVTAITLLNNGALVVTGHRDGHVRMFAFDSASKTLSLVFNPEESNHTERVSDFVVGNSFLLSSGWDGTIIKWDLSGLTGGVIASIPTESVDFATRIASMDLNDAGRIAIATFEKEVLLLDLTEMGNAPATPALEYERSDWSTLGEPDIASVTFTPDGSEVAVCFADRTILMLGASSKQVGVSYNKPASKSRATHFRFNEKPEDEAALDPVFGESSIPDVTLVIPNLDVIQQQNAWGGIWLTRNKVLLGDRETNPAFLFQTPMVRFQNMITPFLINDEIWEVEKLLIKTDGSSDTVDNPIARTLRQHIDTMLDSVLLGGDAVSLYNVRLACRYGFSLANGVLLNRDLLPALPVVMGLKLEQNVTDAERTALVDAIMKWFTDYEPVRDKGKLIFTLNIFSTLSEEAPVNLPLIRIEHLGLDLKFITDLPVDEPVTTG